MESIICLKNFFKITLNNFEWLRKNYFLNVKNIFFNIHIIKLICQIINDYRKKNAKNYIINEEVCNKVYNNLTK